jgi:hypothetical protein
MSKLPPQPFHLRIRKIPNCLYPEHPIHITRDRPHSSSEHTCFSIFASGETPVKRTLVCLILGCVSLSTGQTLPTQIGASVAVERLLRFSGNLAPHRAFVGLVALNFMMYDEPYGGAANWQETQNVQPDAQGRYTVLLGANTLGGLPADAFAPGKAHWLGVGVSGQPEQPRILLIESPSALAIVSPGRATPVAGEGPPHPAMDRYVALFLVILFLLGVWMMCLEALKWRKSQADLSRRSPSAEPEITPAAGYLRLRRAAQTLLFPLSDALRSIRGPVSNALQSIDDGRPKKAA